MKRDKQMRIRVTQEEYELINSSAKEQNMTKTKYIISLVREDAPPLSHEQQIENSVSNNQLINNLLVSPKIPNNIKKLIEQEMKMIYE